MFIPSKVSVNARIVRLIAVTLLAFNLCLSPFAFAAAGPASKGESAKSSPPAKTAAANPSRPKQHLPEGTIDGFDNPERIPDRVAYSLFFRFISGRQTEQARKRVRAYVRQISFGGEECRGCAAGAKRAEPDVEAVLAAADEFHRRVGVLDQQARSIKESAFPNPGAEAMAALAELQRRREALVDELAASLPKKLSADGANRLRRHINERVKRSTKIFPKQKVPMSPAALNAWPAAGPFGGRFEKASFRLGGFSALPAAALVQDSGDTSHYSDTWADEDPGDYLDQPQPTETYIYGGGVTEDPYTSADMSRVEITLTSPSGRSSYATGWGYYGYAQAETALSVNLENPEEGEYNVQTGHWYREYTGGGGDGCSGYDTTGPVMPCYQVTNPNARPRYTEIAYGGAGLPPGLGAARPAQWYWWFWGYSYAYILAGRFAQGFRYVGIEGGYHAYGAYCIGSCNKTRKYHSTYVGPFLQCSGIWVRSIFGRTCIGACFGQNFAPFCR